MDRIWQWAWDRDGASYSRACFAVTSIVALPVFLVWSFVVVTYQKSDRYVEAAALTVLATLLMHYLIMLPGLSGIRLIEQ